MPRFISVFLLLLALTFLCLAEPQKTVYRVNGTEFGSNSFDLAADGTFTSKTDLTSLGKEFQSTLVGKIADGKLDSYNLTQDVPGIKISVSKDGEKVVRTVGDVVTNSALDAPYQALYASNHPQLAFTFLKALKAGDPGQQSIQTLMVDSGTVVPLKVRFKSVVKLAKTSARIIEVDLGSVSIQYAFDDRGAFIGESVPVQKVVATVDGFEGAFVDPLAAYPELSQPTFKTKTMKGIGVRMRDGVILVANVTLPADDGKYPAILFRTPYGKEAAYADAEFYARRGYAYVSQDCRGRDASNGDWDPFVNERKDGADTVDWIAKQPWSDGKVGMIGGSYMGYVQWAAAVEQPPALKCIVPQVSPADAFTNLPYDNGVPMLFAGLWWANIVSGKETHLERAIQPLQNPEALLSLPLSQIDEKVLGEKVPFFRLWLSRDTTEKWKGYDILKDVAKVSIPTLSVSGWWDGDEIGTQLIWQNRRTAGVKNQWLIEGPWTHAFDNESKVGDVDYGADSLLELDSVYLRWFDTWLKGKSVGWERQPRAKVFVTGANKWVELNDWPDPAQEEPAVMYLSDDGPANGLRSVGRFSAEPPGAQEPDRYTYNPANVEVPKELMQGNPTKAGDLTFTADARLDDFLLYKTPPMQKPTTVAGPISLDLYFSTTAKDTDFFAALFDEDEKGVLRYVDQAGKVRASYMDSSAKRTLLTPGKIYHVDIKLWDTAHCFLPGHRLVLYVTSCMFPAFARNLNTGEPVADAVRMVAASQTIYHDAAHPSALKAYVIKNKLVDQPK